MSSASVLAARRRTKSAKRLFCLQSQRTIRAKKHARIDGPNSSVIFAIPLYREPIVNGALFQQTAALLSAAAKQPHTRACMKFD